MATLLIAFPRIYPGALLVLSLGIAVWLVPWFLPRTVNPRTFLLRSLPALLGSVLILAGSVVAGDWLKQRCEAARALPPAGSPNVLLIVLDTVRADRLSLYGYQRATTPNLERLARRGIQFDAARATAPWTLPSHASFFTGRWAHELDVEWLTPVRTSFPMLAEYLGSRGYATAGFVGNVGYCSYESGLGRGLTHHDDYKLTRLSFLRSAVFLDKFLTLLLRFDLRYEGDPPFYLTDSINYWFYSDLRSDASSISGAFVDWLARRPEPARPFFAFLNYFDAHAPYRLPVGATARIGPPPLTRDELRIVYNVWAQIDRLTLPQRYLDLGRDAYDNCIAYVDEQLGSVFHELERRQLMEPTLVLVLSDHGEGLGEHELFDHGESLYSTEVRVPLLILLPGVGQPALKVREVVSLRDVPATVVELVGLSAGAPFPGRSLVRFWRGSPAASDTADSAIALSELFRPNPIDPNRGRAPARRGPLLSLAEGDFLYIRNQGDGTEELYNAREDPRELTNRASNGAFQPVLEQFRKRLDVIKPAARRDDHKGRGEK
jgi:arylsulfatase A-like enzyme